MKKHPKKKRFKLIKAKRKPIFKNKFAAALYDYFKDKGLNNYKAKLYTFFVFAKYISNGIPHKKKFPQGGIVAPSTNESDFNEPVVNPRFSISKKVLDANNASIEAIDKLKHAFERACKVLKQISKTDFLNQNHKPHE